MARRVNDRLLQRAEDTFVGREAELAALLQYLEQDSPVVTAIHGLAGIGKSRLLDAFATEARRRGATVIRLDCRAIEPTDRGFLHELGAAVGADAPSVEEAARRLGRLGDRVVLALDTYEVLRLLDGWLRQVFVPALPENARVVIAGRDPLSSAWLTSPGWQGLVRSLPIMPLEEEAALGLLAAAGISRDQALRINRIACGHPLALTLAAASALEGGATWAEDRAVQQVVEELARLYLSDIEDPVTRKMIDAGAVVRRTTLSLLGAMLPEVAPRDAYERLAALPFVESASDGLRMHDAVQQAAASVLRSSDPTRYREYRRAAWQRLRMEVRSAGRSELWRYTADMLYLIENPIVREAFFPSGPYLSIEPAAPEHGPAIQSIGTAHEGPEAARLLDLWWAENPQAFSSVRDEHGSVTGFTILCDAASVSERLADEDPVTRAWLDHLRAEPIPEGQCALFTRRSLSLEHGERPSPVQAVCSLDMKRRYMELRPHLRRVYGAVCDVGTVAGHIAPLGFRVLPEAEVQIDGASNYTVMLDFGPGSVDSWLAGVVAGELGIADREILDADARELVVEGQRVALTRLELGLMQSLCRHPGKAISRVALLDEVWGYSYQGGSNVVDVVVRSLRKKLGARASMLESVSGVGYRFRGD